MKKLLASTAVMLALACPPLAQDYTPDPAAKPGGTITVTYKDDVATLDPAIGYDWQNWSMIKSLFDGLMDYVPGTTDLRPGLAESYDDVRGRPDLYLQAAPRRQVPQRPRDDGRGREILARPRDQPRHAVARARASSAPSRALTTAGGRPGLSGVEGRRSADRRRSRCPAPMRPSCMSWRSTSPRVVPKEAVDAAGGRFRQEAGRHRGLQAGGMDARPAPGVREERRLLARRACPISIRSCSRSGRSRSWRFCACRTARSTFPATAFRPPSSRK